MGNYISVKEENMESGREDLPSHPRPFWTDLDEVLASFSEAKKSFTIYCFLDRHNWRLWTFSTMQKCARVWRSSDGRQRLNH